MASGTSFKQQCPSCEAMVPIRDPGLIGRKIDCPKCKYRFVVEEPAEEEEAPAKKKGDKGDAKGGKAGPRRRGSEDGDRPAKKKQGGSNMLVLGGGLAVVAVVAIVVCAIAFWPSDDGGSSSTTPSGGAPVSGAAAAPGPEQGAMAAAEKPAPAPSVLVNVTNLLPNDAQAVVAYPVSATLGSALKAAAIDEAEGGFKLERFRQKMGFGLDDVNRIISAVNVRDGWLFTILQTKKPFDPEMLAQQLRLTQEPQVKGKSGKNYDVFAVNSDFDSLGNLLVKLNQPREKLQVYFYDANTLVFADPQPLTRFLQDDTKPEYLTKDAPPPAAAGGNPMGGSPMGGMGPGAGGPAMASRSVAPMGGMMGGAPAGGPPMGAMPGGPPMGAMAGGPPMGMMPGGAPMGTTPGAGQAGPVIAAPVSWMSVDPSLKLVLDRIEKLEENKNTRRKEPASVVTVAGLLGAWQPMILAKLNQYLQDNDVSFLERQAARLVVANDLQRIKTLGASLQAFDQKSTNVVCAVEYSDRRVTEQQDRQFRPMLALLPPLIEKGLGLNIKVAANQPTNPGVNPGGFPGMMSPMGGIGGPPPAGGGPPPMGGFATPPMGSGAPMGTFAGAPGRFGTIGDGGVGGPGFTGQGGADEKNDGSVGLAREDRVLVFSLELLLTSDAYDKLFAPTRDTMQWLKSQADLASTRSRVHELARALKAYFDANKGSFPPGALPRAPAPDRGNLPWRPDQRLSWAAALIPFFGDEFDGWKLNPNQGWNEGRNLAAATRVVPPLVAPQLPGTGPVRLSYPGLPSLDSDPLIPLLRSLGGELGATHFVGVAGLGLDAAEYPSGNQATDAKRGVFGYDRVTQKADIKDGLDRTIALIMVPGEHKSPWLAGGGATLRAVSDDAEDSRPIDPFVCTVYPGKPGEKTRWDGKRGTIAIMADCRVRFIPADIAADTFRALCTISGGETIERLDTICPAIDPPPERQISTEKLQGLPRLTTRPGAAAPATTPAGTPGAGGPAPSTVKLPAGWKEFTSPGGRYAVGMPAGKPLSRRQSQATPAGVIQQQMDGVETSDGKGLIVAYADMPPIPPGGNVDQMFDGARDGMLRSLPGSSLSSESKTTFGSHAAREWTVQFKGGTMRLRGILVGQRLYLLMFGLPPGKADTGEVKIFFDSFRLTS